MSNNKFTKTLDFERKCIKNAETIEKAAKMMCGYSYSDSHCVSREDIIKYMQLGAEWKEKQMIKDLVDGTVSKIGGSVWIDTDDIALERVLNNYEKDAKVKIIIVKEKEI